MLQDSFVETSVKRKNGLTEVIFNTFLIGIAIVAIFFAFFVNFLIGENYFFISGVVCFGFVWGGVLFIVERKFGDVVV